MEYTIIKTEKQYNLYCKKLRVLAEKKPSNAIEDEMELLDLLIETWEKENYKRESLDPIAFLKALMANHNLSRTDLATKLDIKKSALSQILSYRKGLSKEVIRKLSEHFCMSQEAFNRPYELISDANKGHKNEKMMNTTKDLVLA